MHARTQAHNHTYNRAHAHTITHTHTHTYTHTTYYTILLFLKSIHLHIDYNQKH